jgi:hypothetical protein
LYALRLRQLSSGHAGGSAFLAVHNLEGGAPRLRTHRASPLPRRRHVARRSSRDAADGDETHAVALSSPHGWLDELSEDARAAQEDLRLSEVGVEVPIRVLPRSLALAARVTLLR